jgi:glycopeptide antibiotics resistance protein
MNKQRFEQILVRIVPLLASFFYSSLLVYIFFFARRRWVQVPNRIVHVIPFREKILYLQSYSVTRGRENFEFFKDIAGNILLFIPFPFLLRYVFGIKSYRRLLWMSIAFSFLVETLQFIVNRGVADIDDLVLNTLGACFGLLIMYAAALRNIGSPSDLPAAIIKEPSTLPTPVNPFRHLLILLKKKL